MRWNSAASGLMVSIRQRPAGRRTSFADAQALHLRLSHIRVQSSRRLEREAGRNLEVMLLTGRLAPDHKTIADFRKDNGSAIKKVCARFVEFVPQDGPAGESECRDRRQQVPRR